MIAQSFRRRHIAICIAFGPEVRAFIHSGFARRLAERYDVTVLAYRPDSAALTGLDEVKVVPMPRVSEPYGLAAYRSWSNCAQSEMLRRQGGGVWAHWLRSEPASRKARVLRAVPGGLRVLTPAVRRLERQLGRQFGTQPVWQQLFTELGIDAVIAGSGFHPRILPALQTATNRGLVTILAFNSWKDIYSAPNFAVVPSRVVVWSQRAANDLLAMNPHVSSHRVVVIDSLHLEPFVRPGTIPDRQEFCARVGLDPARPFLCYTAAAPTAVRHEERILAFLLSATRNGRIPARPQVLVRLNPMDNGRRFAALAGEFVIQKPAWEWDGTADWCCALPADIPQWVATAYHAALNISIASTVTLEFKTLGRPVVNVCFDLPAPLPAATSNRRFWEAAFYAEIRERGDAVPAFSPDELVRAVTQQLTATPTGHNGDQPVPLVSPVDKLLAVVAEVLPV
ncbi:MAG: hypothetical protein WCG79_00535 [Verrucomicrobiota bacterium]|jgi:hypothetical protein